MPRAGPPLHRDHFHPLAPRPPWLQAIARFKPLTDPVDALRGAMVPGQTAAVTRGTDRLVLAAVFAVLMAMAVKPYPGVVR